MPVISSYALQYKDVDFQAISTSTFDLFITEGAPLAPGGGFPGITPSQVAQLRTQGRTVVGMVNVAVTDDTRYYWESSWTSNGHDTGTPIPGQAPSWLDQAVPYNFAGDQAQDALIVEYWDPAWQQIVIAQAVELINQGYSGVFLDDVGRYFQAGEGSGNIPLMANRMLDFIHAIRIAVTAANPAAIIVTNANPYIVTDSPDGGFSARAATHRADVDIHLIENQGIAAHNHFATYFGGEPLLILQSITPPQLTYDQAWSRGILYTATDMDYDQLGTFAYPATAGADTLSGGDGPNQIDGLGGNDVLNGGNGIDQLTGGEGNDTLNGGGGTDTMIGGQGNDTYIFDSAGDIATEASGQGSDIVFTAVSYTLASNSDVESLATIDFEATTALNLNGNALANTLIGNDGNNQLDGKSGADVMVGRDGDDKYLVDNAADKTFEDASQGYDVVFTGVSVALTNDQEIEGLSSIDWNATYALNLTGNSLNNYLIGNAGTNALDGKGGNDTLQGREGADSYAFTTVLGATNVDVILGFSAADDTIVLENNGVFTGLSAGALPASAFVVGTAAQDLNDRIVYNQATGQLFFDADGSGAGAQVQFARLDGAPVISAGDFTVI